VGCRLVKGKVKVKVKVKGKVTAKVKVKVKVKNTAFAITTLAQSRRGAVIVCACSTF